MEYLANLSCSPGSEALALKAPFFLLFAVKVRFLTLSKCWCPASGVGVRRGVCTCAAESRKLFPATGAGIVALPSKDPCGKAG